MPGRPLIDGFDWKRDEPLDLDRPESGRLREDQHLVGRDVRHGVDGQPQHRIDADADDDGRKDQDEELVAKREVDQTMHRRSSSTARRSARAAARS